MSALCGTTGKISKEEVDAMVIKNPSGSTTISSSSNTASHDLLLECDYETSPTKLYQAIEAKEWEDVLYFLETSTWKNSGIWPTCGTPWLFSDTQSSEASAPIQAKTWVTAIDESTEKVRWCQLPLHAAITFGAPLPVIQQLLLVYPPSARCADDHDLLPLHYAFRFGASDPVLWTILEAFPPAMRKRAAKDRLPLDLAAYSSRPERGYILEQYMTSAVYSAQKEWNAAKIRTMKSQGRQNHSDIDANKKQVESEQTALLKHKLQQKTQRLQATLAELQATKDELEQTQRQFYEERQAATPSSWKYNASFSSEPKEMPPPADIADSSHFDEDDLRDDLATTMTSSMIRAPQQKQPWKYSTKEDPDSSLRSCRSIRLGEEAQSKQGRRSRSTTGAKRAIRSIFGRRGRRPVDPE